MLVTITVTIIIIKQIIHSLLVYKYTVFKFYLLASSFYNFNIYWKFCLFTNVVSIFQHSCDYNCLLDIALYGNTISYCPVFYWLISSLFLNLLNRMFICRVSLFSHSENWRNSRQIWIILKYQFNIITQWLKPSSRFSSFMSLILMTVMVEIIHCKGINIDTLEEVYC